MDPDAVTRQPAGSHPGEPTAWFDEFYRAAAGGRATVPWDTGAPNPLLVE
jgi:hypothetical protein